MNVFFNRLFFKPAPYRTLVFFLGSLFLATVSMTQVINGMMTTQNTKPLFIKEYTDLINQYETRKTFNSLRSHELLTKLEQYPHRLSVCQELSQEAGHIVPAFFTLLTVFADSIYVERMLGLFDHLECQQALTLFLKNYMTFLDSSNILWEKCVGLKSHTLSPATRELLNMAFKKCGLTAPLISSASPEKEIPFLLECSDIVNQYTIRKTFNHNRSASFLSKLEKYPGRISICKKLAEDHITPVVFFTLLTVFSDATQVKRMLGLFDSLTCQPALSLFLKNYATLFHELKQQPLSLKITKLINEAFKKCNLEVSHLLVESSETEKATGTSTQSTEKVPAKKRRLVGQRAYEKSQQIIAEQANRMPLVDSTNTLRYQSSTHQGFTTTTSITHRPVILEKNALQADSSNTNFLDNNISTLFDSPKKANNSLSRGAYEDDTLLSADELIALMAAFDSPIKSAMNNTKIPNVEAINSLCIDQEAIVFEEEYLDDNSSSESEEESPADQMRKRAKLPLMPRKLFNQSEHNVQQAPSAKEKVSSPVKLLTGVSCSPKKITEFEQELTFSPFKSSPAKRVLRLSPQKHAAQSLEVDNFYETASYAEFLDEWDE